MHALSLPLSRAPLLWQRPVSCPQQKVKAGCEQGVGRGGPGSRPQRPSRKDELTLLPSQLWVMGSVSEPAGPGAGGVGMP